MDPNTLNLDPDPGYWLNLDPDPGPDLHPDPGLKNQFCTKKKKKKEKNKFLLKKFNFFKL